VAARDAPNPIGDPSGPSYIASGTPKHSENPSLLEQPFCLEVSNRLLVNRRSTSPSQKTWYYWRRDGWVKEIRAALKDPSHRCDAKDAWAIREE